MTPVEWWLLHSGHQGGNMSCTYCGSHTHDTKYCPKTWDGQGNINARWCDYCGSRDHEYEQCKKHA